MKRCTQKVRAGEPNTAQVHGEMQDALSEGLVGATNHPPTRRRVFIYATTMQGNDASD